ncbi:unnamed protein product [Miscanthus lutarioriparius]|uniref:TF-B3 domain-containing protein n=1 Tax=Miscanthus lutarioriparius TaxID=422564 RepID=A0A811NC98_9POAL|nr:unnamed protein product [Miscanthus lutarioriparius]
MEEKMELIKWRTDLLDSGAGSSKSDKDDDAIPMDDELAIVVANEPAALAIHCGDTDDDDGEGYDANGHHISVSVDENRESAMARAEEIQSNLPAEHPSFIKHMLRSHVIKGFWLGLPKHFCDKHLPNRDVVIVLEDENGEDHDTTYLGYKQGLSAGWRGFAIDHGIKVGDVVVFELVKSTKFKVYIVRANGFKTADVDPNLLNLEARKKGEEQSCEDVITEEDTEDTTNNNREVPPSDGSSRNGIGISYSEIDFDDVTSFSDVNVILVCLATDCEFHDRLRRTYYELCCSQKSLLHKHLLKQLHPTLVAGVIMEMVSIADGIRACKAEASSREDFLVWKKTLEAFELLGMNVAFLLNRVNGLLGVASRSRESYAEWQDKYEELKLERARAGVKMKALELQLSTVM